MIKKRTNRLLKPHRRPWIKRVFKRRSLRPTKRVIKVKKKQRWYIRRKKPIKSIQSSFPVNEHLGRFYKWWRGRGIRAFSVWDYRKQEAYRRELDFPNSPLYQTNFTKDWPVFALKFKGFFSFLNYRSRLITYKTQLLGHHRKIRLIERRLYKLRELYAKSAVELATRPPIIGRLYKLRATLIGLRDWRGIYDRRIAVGSSAAGDANRIRVAMSSLAFAQQTGSGYQGVGNASTSQ